MFCQLDTPSRWPRHYQKVPAAAAVLDCFDQHHLRLPHLALAKGLHSMNITNKINKQGKEKLRLKSQLGSS